MTIATRVQDSIFSIEIARPDKKNAFTARMYQQFADHLHAADADPAISAILIQGQPDIFSAGNDIEDFLAEPPRGNDAPVFQFMRSLIVCGKPVIAAVRGPAVGVGATLLLHCDLVYLAEDTRLTMPFVGLGLVPEFASSLILPKLAGTARAAEYLLTGAPISAAAAVACGIANQALPSAEVLAHSSGVAARFNKLPAEAVRATKQLLRRWSLDEIHRAVDAEAKVFRERLDSAEAKAAFKSFLDRRAGKPS